MKSLPLLLAASTFLSCHSAPEPQVQPASSIHQAEAGKATFDLSACGERAMTAEEFVKRCQEATRLNFTYDKDTREALAAQEFRFDGPKKLPASEISGFVTAQLAHCGLTCKAIGPEQLHTFLITSAAAR